jgi:uncharacterized protein with HEPN domain
MRSDRFLLQDILDAIATVQQYLPVDRERFDSDPPLQSHLYRHIMIIGEAAFRLSKTLKAANPHVPWKRIEGMRHILVHDYFRVDWNEVHRTAVADVPSLKPLIQSILASLPQDVE